MKTQTRLLIPPFFFLGNQLSDLVKHFVTWYVIWPVTPLCSYTPMFLHPFVPTPLCSYTPMFLHPYVPIPLCSDNLCSYTPMFLQPMFLHPYVPTPLCSYTLCSYTTVFLHPYVPTPLCSYAPIFLPPYILTLFARSALGKWN